MSLENKQEKEVNSMVYCRGVNGMLVRENCNNECDHFGGGKKEPIFRTEDGMQTQIGVNEYILCLYPKLEKVHKLFEVI